MANIKLHDLATLNLDGSDLFGGPESFMVDLNDENEMDQVLGGGKCGSFSVVVCGKDTVDITCHNTCKKTF